MTHDLTTAPLVEHTPNGATSAPARRSRLLDDISIELLPEHVAGFNPSAALLPLGSYVFITHIAGKPLELQREAANAIKRMGYEPVPHLAARNFRTVEDYAAHLTELTKCGVDSVLMIGGNPGPERTALECAADLLKQPFVRQLGLRRVFFGGHPEGHPNIPAQSLKSAMIEKVSVARALGIKPHIVTQFAFDGVAMSRWASGLRSDGIDCPIRLGLAGVTSLTKLVKFSMLCGVGASLSALTRQGGSILKAVREQDPGDVLKALEVGIAAHRLEGASIHFFPFGGWEKTLDWVGRERKQQ